jgi:hypothetical protein
MILNVEDFPFFWDTHDTSGIRKLALFPLQIIHFHYAGNLLFISHFNIAGTSLWSSPEPVVYYNSTLVLIFISKSLYIGGTLHFWPKPTMYPVFFLWCSVRWYLFSRTDKKSEVFYGHECHTTFKTWNSFLNKVSYTMLHSGVLYHETHRKIIIGDMVLNLRDDNYMDDISKPVAIRFFLSLLDASSVKSNQTFQLFSRSSALPPVQHVIGSDILVVSSNWD